VTFLQLSKSIENTPISHPVSVMRRYFVILVDKANLFACLFGRVDPMPVLEHSLCYCCLD
jgi:hypothetical protein